MDARRRLRPRRCQLDARDAARQQHVQRRCIDAYAMRVSLAPSTTGSTTRGMPPIDVTGANWIRVRVYDVDGTNPGAISALAFGVRRERHSTRARQEPPIVPGGGGASAPTRPRSLDAALIRTRL